MKRILLYCLALLLPMASCMRADENAAGEEPVAVDFVVSAHVESKSSVTSLDTELNTINIMVYFRGELVSSLYSASSGRLNMTLHKSMPYNIYVLANVGKVTAPSAESDLWDYCISLDKKNSVAGFSANGLPMAGIMKDVSLYNSSTSITVFVQRLVAKLNLKLDSHALKGLRVSSVMLRQCAGVIQPFPGGERALSRVTSSADAVDGDYASRIDILNLSLGNSITFYVPENCQGVLLPSNKDPWNKIPSNLAYASLCTYLELACSFGPESIYSGDITYRMFLGRDNCSDFNVEGNTDSSITLYLSGDTGQISWKIDADIALKDALASATIKQALHKTWNNQYIGESAQISVSFSDNLTSELDGDILSCSLALLNEDLEVQNCVSFSSLVSLKGEILSTMKALRPMPQGNCSIWLLRKDGTPLCPVQTDEPFGIEKPFAKLAPISESGYIPEPVTPVVNGKAASFALSLEDADGVNLNGPQKYLFDKELFSGCALTFKPRTVCGNFTIRTLQYSAQKPNHSNNYAVLQFILQSVNSGSDGSMNKILSTLRGYEQEHYYISAESELVRPLNRMSGSAAILPPIVVTASPDSFDGSAAHSPSSNTKAYLLVCNPSKIALHGECLYIGTGTMTLSSTAATPHLFTSCSHDHSASKKWYGYSIPFSIDNSVLPERSVKIKVEQMGTTTAMKTAMVSDYGEAPAFLAYCVTQNRGMSFFYNVARAASKALDISVRDAEGESMPYYAFDLNGKYLSADGTANTGSYSAVWGPSAMKYYGLVADDALNSLHAGNILKENCNTYSFDNAMHIFKDPIQAAILYQDGAIRIKMENNTYGSTMKWTVQPTFHGRSRFTRNYLAAKDSADYYMKSPLKTLATSAVSYNGVVNSDEDMGYYFATLNRTYWHESCTSVTNLAGTRFSALSKPLDAHYDITLEVTPATEKWVPYMFGSSLSQVRNKVSYAIYERTAAGTYVTNAGHLPNGESVGWNATAASVARVWLDYTPCTTQNFYYTLTSAVENTGMQVFYVIK